MVISRIGADARIEDPSDPGIGTMAQRRRGRCHALFEASPGVGFLRPREALRDFALTWAIFGLLLRGETAWRNMASQNAETGRRSEGDGIHAHGCLMSRLAGRSMSEYRLRRMGMRGSLSRDSTVARSANDAGLRDRFSDDRFFFSDAKRQPFSSERTD